MDQEGPQGKSNWTQGAGRDAVRVFGLPMKDRWWESVDRHAHPGELPWFIINSGASGRLIAFADRLLISKTGGLTSFLAGSFGAGRETVFPYSEITNIEFNGGMINGVLEVLTPSYQGTSNHDFWRSANKSRNKAHDDPWTLSNCLPLANLIYREAQPTLNELLQRISQAKQGFNPSGSAPGVQSPTEGPNGLARELEQLAELHQRGLLDDDEFKAAKQATIARLS